MFYIYTLSAVLKPLLLKLTNLLIKRHNIARRLPAILVRRYRRQLRLPSAFHLNSMRNLILYQYDHHVRIVVQVGHQLFLLQSMLLQTWTSPTSLFDGPTQKNQWDSIAFVRTERCLRLWCDLKEKTAWFLHFSCPTQQLLNQQSQCIPDIHRTVSSLHSWSQRCDLR